MCGRHRPNKFAKVRLPKIKMPKPCDFEPLNPQHRAWIASAEYTPRFALLSPTVREAVIETPSSAMSSDDGDNEEETDESSVDDSNDTPAVSDDAKMLYLLASQLPDF
jgi:hypothetical protein